MYIMNSPDLVPKGVLDPTLFWPHASLDFHDRALGKSVFHFHLADLPGRGQTDHEECSTLFWPIAQAVGKLTTRVHDGRSRNALGRFNVWAKLQCPWAVHCF